MENKNIIYGLVDPRNGELRYVGQTTNGLSRLNSHLKPSHLSKGTSPVKSWMKSLKSQKLKPEIFVIEDMTVDELDAAEEFYIAYFKTIGANLTNLASGGANRGWKHTDEWRERMHKIKVGVPMPSGHADRIREGMAANGGTWCKGKKLSAETRAKMSAAKKGKKPNNWLGRL